MSERWVELPKELTKDTETIELTIQFLKIIKKINQGKYVPSLKGLKNKVRYYFLGFSFIPKT